MDVLPIPLAGGKKHLLSFTLCAFFHMLYGKFANPILYIIGSETSCNSLSWELVRNLHFQSTLALLNWFCRWCSSILWTIPTQVKRKVPLMETFSP